MLAPLLWVGSHQIHPFYASNDTAAAWSAASDLLVLCFKGGAEVNNEVDELSFVFPSQTHEVLVVMAC